MPGKAALAHELGGDDASCEVRVVIGFDPDIGIRQAGADQLRDLFRTHGRHLTVFCPCPPLRHLPP